MKPSMIPRMACSAVLALSGLVLAPVFTASAFAASSASAATAAASHTYNCKGGDIAPGTYRSIVITGVCYMPKGTIVIRGDLTVARGALLDATSPGDPPSKPLVPATVLIGGNVNVGKGAALLLGCSPNISCPSGVTTDRVGGNITAIGAQGVVVHSTSIGGNATMLGGGGGPAAATCAAQPTGKPPIPALKPWSENPNLDMTPVYSDFEDNAIGGNLTISGLKSCWLGSLRDRVRGNVTVAGNRMGDPDAMEIGNNLLGGNLVCLGNTPAVQFGDGEVASNLVGGLGIGECGFNVVLPDPAPGANQGPGVFQHIAVSLRSLRTYLGSHIQLSGSSQLAGTTISGHKIVVSQNSVVLTGSGLRGKVSEEVLSTVFPGGSSSFEALDQCTCSFRGKTGSVTLRAYGTSSARGVTSGTFLVASGGAGHGALGTLAGWGTFTSRGQRAGTLRLVEHLRIT